MIKQLISEKAPKAVGAYSQGMIYNDLIFLSGQVACEPETGEQIEGGIKEQTVRVLENIKALLEDAGSDFNHVLKFSIYLANYDRDFDEMNKAYADFFENVYPARVTYGVAKLYSTCLVEIDTVAVKK